MPAALIFDMDGTLWDSREQVVASWNEVLATEPELRPPFTVEEMTPLFGLSMDRLGARVLPFLSEEKRNTFLLRCFANENAYILKHGAVLYPELGETLAKLKEICPLYIVSNCQTGYIEAFLEHFGFWNLFADRQCYGNNGLQKGRNIRILVERAGLAGQAADCIYVGDTQGDYDAATEAGVGFIQAAYGFGTVKEPVRRLERFADLPAMLG